MLNQEIGKRLAMIRAHRRMTQAELAAAVGLTAPAISQYEHGKVQIKATRLAQLARALHCRVTNLLEYDAPLPRVTFRGGPAAPFLHSAAGLWAPPVITD
jgi:transcriptional regulator with XRE-family HTH domain